MKKYLSLFLAISIVMTGLVFAPVASADANDPYAIAVPSTWELIGEESFIREPVDNGDGTTTSTFPLSTYESSMLTTSSNLKGDDYAYINSEGLQLITPKQSNNNMTLSLNLSSPFDLTTDADYYITYDLKPHSPTTGSTTFKLYNSADSTKYLQFSLSSNNGKTTFSQEIKASKSTSENNTDINYNLYKNTWNKVLIQISSRSDGRILMRQRWFNLNGDSFEVPSLNPMYWDTQMRVDLAATEIPTIDTWYMALSTNNGNVQTNVYRNFKVYKDVAVNSYVTTPPPAKTLSNSATDWRNYQTLAVVSTPNSPYTMTMDSTPDGYTTVEQGWYDYTNPESPVLLATGASIDVPANMKGRVLRAMHKVMNPVDSTEITYYPFSGIVRDVIELLPNINSNVRNSSPIAVSTSYYAVKDATKGTYEWKSKHSATSYVDALTYDQWADETLFQRVSIGVNFKINGNVNSTDGMVTMLVAVYDNDGMLKKMYKATPDDTTRMTRPYVLAQYASRNTASFSLNFYREGGYYTAENVTNIANYIDWPFEPGDSVKAYLWRSTTTPDPINKKYYYNFEHIIPVDLSVSYDREYYDVSQPVITIPYPVEAE